MISVPVLLLWNVQISPRRKFALWGVLCLSIFTAITAIITIAGGNTSHGQVDSAWVIFWQQAEAAVALIVVSVSAFRALFVARKASKAKSPTKKRTYYRPMWSWKSKERRLLPSLPSPTFTGMRTIIREAPYNVRDIEASTDMNFPLAEPRVLVRRDVSAEVVRLSAISCVFWELIPLRVIGKGHSHSFQVRWCRVVPFMVSGWTIS